VIAVVPVRAGELPLGAEESVAEANGLAVLIGDGCEEAAALLRGVATGLATVEVGNFAPGAWADALAPHLAAEAAIVLPSSPDGRDLAARLAHRLGWPLLAGAQAVRHGWVERPRHGGRSVERCQIDGPFVATLEPGGRGFVVDARAEAPMITPLPVRIEGEVVDPVVVAVQPPDPATVGLADAERIVGGGAGLGDAETLGLLADAGLALGAALGATRVVTDQGWTAPERQIGTTGVVVGPRLYLACGISGAVQHTAGLGQPDHVISVNTDRSCPMMALADLAIVADAPSTVRALARRLGVETATGGDAETATGEAEAGAAEAETVESDGGAGRP